MVVKLHSVNPRKERLHSSLQTSLLNRPAFIYRLIQSHQSDDAFHENMNKKYPTP
ncbi:MAG: hypothetical protein LZF86_110947 [Nitrospira sp.]|nr:MAG: hypothetical protein LZF86_110947 [Nitrospira sp.]